MSEETSVAATETVQATTEKAAETAATETVQATTQQTETTKVEDPAWFATFGPDNREAIVKAGWKEPGEILKSYSELRIKVAEKGLQEPGKDASKAEWDAYHKARGRPELPQDYSFELSKELPTDLPYDAKFAESFRLWAHESGLSKSQAQQLHDRYVSQMADVYKQQADVNNSRVTTAHETLIKEWGDTKSETYIRNVEMATRAIRNLDPGLSAALKEAGFLASDGTVLSAPIAKAFAKAGSQLFAEDTLYGGTQVGALKNPFARATENLTEQGKIAKSDPERARQLQRLAGVPVTI